MIAVDTNILVYAHRRDSAFHAPAVTRLRELAEGRPPWAIPWPCIHELLAVVTHPRLFDPPSTLDEAVDQVEAWLESPALVVMSEQDGYWEDLRTFLSQGRIIGPQVHDARIAALCAQHGVRELWSADRDFSRFPSLNVRNPLVET